MPPPSPTVREQRPSSTQVGREQMLPPRMPENVQKPNSPVMQQQGVIQANITKPNSPPLHQNYLQPDSHYLQVPQNIPPRQSIPVQQSEYPSSIPMNKPPSPPPSIKSPP